MLFSKDNIGLELINFQNKDKFPIKLTQLIEKIYLQMDSNVYTKNSELLEKSSYVKDINNLIKERFNINVIIDKELSVLDMAAIIPFFSDYLDEKRRLSAIGVDNLVNLFKFAKVFKRINAVVKERDAMLKRLNNKKGYIDLKNARVGGYLSDLKHYLILDFFALRSHDLSPVEVTAILMHEIGHAFGGLEYHFKLEKTNSTIVDILSDINNNKDDKAVFNFKTKFDIKKDIPVGTSKERFDFHSQVAFVYIGEIRTQLMNSKYDETNFENIADSFVGRFGLSRELASSLNKIHLKHGHTSTSSSGFHVIFMLQILANILFIALFGVVGIAITVATLAYVFGKANSDLTYDIPLDRYTRIKNSIVNNIKNLNLPNDVIKDLLDQYVFVTNVIEKSNYFEGAQDTVADYIMPASRDAKYYIKLQRDIEDGLNNILFIKAAQIKTG